MDEKLNLRAVVNQKDLELDDLRFQYNKLEHKLKESEKKLSKADETISKKKRELAKYEKVFQQKNGRIDYSGSASRILQKLHDQDSC